MRFALLSLTLLLSACTAEANLHDAPTPEPVESSDVDRIRSQLGNVDDALASLRSRLSAAELDADVTAQALDVHEQVVDYMTDALNTLERRVDEAEATGAITLEIGAENEAAVAEQDARLVAVEDEASDLSSRVNRIESAPVGLRAVDQDSAVCGLAQAGSGVIFRAAPDLRPNELLLRSGEDNSLRVVIPTPVTCGATSYDEAGAPEAVTEGGAVYLVPDAGGWFHVGA